MPEKISKPIIIEKLNILIQPFKNRHARHYRDSHFHFWADLFLAGALVGSAIVLVWLLFWQPKADFVLEPRLNSAKVLSGQAEEFIVHYENQEGEAINSVILSLDLPKNMQIVSTSSAEIFDTASNTFVLGDLDNGAKGEVSFKALIRGELGERQFIGFNINYRDGQIRKQLLGSLVYHIEGSVLELSLDVPEKTYRNIPFDGIINVKNSSNIKLENIGVAFVSPSWEITPNEGALEEGRIIIPALEAGEAKQLSFSALANELSESLGFAVVGVIMIEARPLTQLTVEKKLAVIEPSLVLGSSFEQESFSESPVDLSLTMQNNDKDDISNIVLSISSQRETISVVSVSTANSGFNTNNNSITVDGVLSAGAKKTASISIDLKRHGTVFNDFINLGIKVSYVMNNENFSYTLAAPKLKIDSNLSVSSAGYYYGPQGDQLGIGPIPPQVDIPTTYWVIWEANNLGNDVANFEVSAELPGNIVWLDQKSLVAGDIVYSPVTRRVLWQVDKLSQNGGNYRASFAISLVPRSEDLGTVPNLLTNIDFRGDDQYSMAKINKKLANITTNIEKDRQAAGKGMVEALK